MTLTPCEAVELEASCSPSENGYRSTGYPREVYLECPDDEDKWVTELQEPLTTA